MSLELMKRALSALAVGAMRCPDQCNEVCRLSR